MNIATIQLPSELNSHDAIQAAERLRSHLQGGRGPVRVSLRGTRSIDGSGMSALYRVVAHARSARRPVHFVNVSASLERQLEAFGLGGLVERERPSFFARFVGRARLAAA